MGSIPILIVEGNSNLRSLLAWHLQKGGYSVKQCANLQQGRICVDRYQPLLVAIDSDLPDGSGLEMCRWLREQGDTLIFMLSARNSEQDVVRALKAGADDYLKKPFGIQEFLARVEVLLRRIRSGCTPLYLEYQDLKIDLVQRRVTVKNRSIELTPQEFSLLYVLAQAQGNPLTRSQLLNLAWPDRIDNPRTIDTHVLSLRKKIESDPKKPSLIQTVRNIGYRFNNDFNDSVSNNGVVSS